MEIRLATAHDVPALIELGRRMHDESPRFSRLPYDPGKVERTARAMLENPWALVLVAERDGAIVGMLAVIVVDYFFCDERQAVDLVVYVAPEHRGSSAAPRLLRELDRVLRADGRVREAVLGISTEVNSERTQALYQRLGFRPAGAIMVKDLSGC